MASPALQTICDKIQECSICTDQYKHPKTLGCLHSFCKQCLLNYYGNSTTMPCPICRKDIKLPPEGVSGLKSKLIICELCAEKEATHRCLDCAQNICSNCQKIHNQIAVTSKHTVMSLEDIRIKGKITIPKKPEEDELRCNKHKGGMNLFYCDEPCKVLICRDCTVVDHRYPEHQYIDIAEASLKYKKTMIDILPEFSREIKKCEQSLADTSRAQQDFGKKVLRTVKEVKFRADQLRAEVKVEEDRIIRDIKTLEQDRNATFDGLKKTINRMLQNKQHSFDIAKYVTTQGSDSDFLSMYPIINEDLTLLKSQDPPQIDAQLSFLQFNQTQRVGDISLGELEIKDSKWELSYKFGKKGSGRGEFNVTWSITTLGSDKLVVTDHNNKRVVLCSTVGKHKDVIKMDSNPYHITRINNHLVVTDTTGQVKMYKEDGTLEFQFTTLPLNEVGKTDVGIRGVTAKKDGNILVGDVKRMVVTEHRSTDGGLISIMPVTTRPYFLAVDNSGRVVISGGDQQHVAVLGENSCTLFTIKPTIDGQKVKFCRGVCYDTSSGLYIAVLNKLVNTGHIHHYDSCGRFLSCIAEGLYAPCGITLTSDGKCLAVADSYSVKIYHIV